MEYDAVYFADITKLYWLQKPKVLVRWEYIHVWEQCVAY